MRVSAPRWCAALHLVAAVGTLILLRGGSEAVADIEQRAAWIRDHAWQWRTGWILWMIAAASLLAFYRWWAAGIRARSAQLAVAVAAIGLVSDFSGELIFIVAMPHPASELHRIASLLTGGLANALYTVAGAWLTVLTPTFSPFARLWAWLVWFSGVALTAATVAGVPLAVVATGAALMILFTPFPLAVEAGDPYIDGHPDKSRR